MGKQLTDLRIAKVAWMMFVVTGRQLHLTPSPLHPVLANATTRSDAWGSLYQSSNVIARVGIQLPSQ